MMRKRSAAAPLLAALLFSAPGLAPAQESGKCVQSAEHDAVTYFLVDRSDPIEDADGFRKTAAALDEMIAPGERLVVGVAAGKGNDTRVLMDFVRPANSVWVSTLKIRAQQKQFKECLAAVVDGLVAESEKHDHSALLETLGFASKVLAGGAAKKRVVLYSDMMQNSPSVSFFSFKPFDADRALELVKKERLLAPFDSVEVYAAGTGAHVSDKQARELEHFWQSYFKAGGGALKFYGPILLKTEAS